ncbi:MAG: PAS domain S-box protein, partial [Candidatus Lokiarchaeota archaeon]|nr:PAS domain S-box protein [Candidatus Lokiarchaeota archaeon]
MIKDYKQNFTYPNERLQTIINNILDIIVEIDLNGSFTYVSPQSVQVLGYEPKELIGRKALRYVHPNDLKIVMNAMRKAIENNQHLSFEYRAKHKNGNYVYISAKGGIFNQNDESKLIVVIRDISQEKIAEEKIKESEQHYRKIIESIGDPIQVMDNSLEIIMANSAFKEWINIFGIYSDILGTTPFELFPFLPKVVADEYEYVFESGQTLITEESNIFNGKTIYTEIRKIPIFTNGEVNQIVTILRDITEKKKTGQNLKESEEKFRTITEQSFMGIIIIQDGIFKYINERATEINGYSFKEIQNWKPYEFVKLIHPDNREFVLEQVRKKESGDEDVVEHYKYRIITKTREIRWIEIFSKTISYRSKPADLVMSIDITDKMIAEQKLKESEYQYRHLFENSPNAIVVTDVHGTVLDQNNAVERIFGISRYE